MRNIMFPLQQIKYRRNGPEKSKLSILQDSFKPSQVFLSFMIKISYPSHDKKIFYCATI